jgi:Nuclease-related domain
MSSKKSPLMDAPLHNPGQSLDERIDKVLNEDAVGYYAMIVLALYLAINEWYRAFFPAQPHPWTITSAAIIMIGFSVIKLRRILIKVRSLRLGRDGEKIVGQYLEELRANGYRVFHDIVGKDFNVDHVIISPQGIYVIETKTLSKPRGKDAKVVFDGEILLVDGKDRNKYLAQVKSLSIWLRNELKTSTGKVFTIKPVIVFPGWYVESKGPIAHKDVWVVNPKALPSFIPNEPISLQQADVELATYHLSRYIRSI